ncbi:MAG: replication restart DNA helicase PriA [Kovacikia sp.]
MDTLMVVRCPNCGSLAQRRLSDHLPGYQACPAQQVAQTECPVCDYFIVMCWQTCRVLEAYAPGR